MAFRGIAAGQGGDFGPLDPIDDDGPARTGGIVEASQALGLVAVAPRGDRIVLDPQGGGDSGEGLAAVEFEQGGGTSEGFDGERTLGEQGLQGGSVGVSERKVLFLHPASLPQDEEQCTKTLLTH